MHIWNGRSWASAPERTDPIYHRGAHPFGPPAPLTLDSPALPPIFAQCVERVHALDRSLGRSPDERSDRAAACLATEAMANGLTRVDHVMLSTATPSLQAGHHLFAVQGSPSNPAHMRAHVETEVAINTPIEVSVQRGLDLQQEQLTQQQRMQPNTGTATPGTGDRIDGDTGLVFPSCSPIRSQPLARRVHSYRMKVTQPAGDRAQRITPINRRPTPGSVTM
ncbi:XVIPCD domain-containing protein [Xanthomonas axonopodis]|uniref:XVIPCD domain-containing protein n=1 Tax=Xanthomonas axonopodis TaxID=53413 RepID=UPI003CCE744D